MNPIKEFAIARQQMLRAHIVNPESDAARLDELNLIIQVIDNIDSTQALIQQALASRPTVPVPPDVQSTETPNKTAETPKV